MYINITYEFHRIPDTQSYFITKVHDLLGQPSYFKHFGINSEYISELVQNIFHFHFTKKKIKVYYWGEIGNIPLCYLCYQIEETLKDMLLYTLIVNKQSIFVCVIFRNTYQITYLCYF